MYSSDITLIRSSFAHVAPIADTAAQLFYNRLFELDGSLRSLFHSDLERQGRLLMKMISTAVDHLDDLDTLAPLVEQLGQRHKIYGVEPGHYDTVGAALLWTLEQGLGEHYTPEVEQAWANAYGLLSGVMQGAAEDTPAPLIENEVAVV